MLVHSVVLVSAVQWSLSYMHTYIPPACWTSLLPGPPSSTQHPIHPGYHRALSWAPWSESGMTDRLTLSRMKVSSYSSYHKDKKINICKISGSNFFNISAILRGCLSTKPKAWAPQTPWHDKENGLGKFYHHFGGSEGQCIIFVCGRGFQCGIEHAPISKTFLTHSFSFLTESSNKSHYLLSEGSGTYWLG